MKINCNIVMHLIFLGSVFLTSENFVDAFSTPKRYFVIAASLCLVMYLAVFVNQIYFGVLRSKKILWGIGLICFAQAVFGIGQFVGWFSNSTGFKVVGSFDNPAGFAAILALGFPVNMQLLLREKGLIKYMAISMAAIVIIAVLLSSSRTGILALFVSFAIFLFLERTIWQMLRMFKSKWFVTILIVPLFLLGIHQLYHHKKDSADGRILIWTVSGEMVKDKTMFGHGNGAFQAQYMDYQARYFKRIRIRNMLYWQIIPSTLSMSL